MRNILPRNSALGYIIMNELRFVIEIREEYRFIQTYQLDEDTFFGFKQEISNYFRDGNLQDEVIDIFFLLSIFPLIF